MCSSVVLCQLFRLPRFRDSTLTLNVKFFAPFLTSSIQTINPSVVSLNPYLVFITSKYTNYCEFLFQNSSNYSQHKNCNVKINKKNLLRPNPAFPKKPSVQLHSVDWCTENRAIYLEENFFLKRKSCFLTPSFPFPSLLYNPPPPEIAIIMPEIML